MSEEVWKDIPWYEWLYQASNLWRIKSLITRWWKCPWIISLQFLEHISWYKTLRTRLTPYSWQRKTYWVHRLIASAFLWFDLNTKMKDAVIMHLDNNPLNNRVENLKIWTQSENTRQCITENRWKQFWRKWEQHWNSKYTEEIIHKIRRLHSEWISYRRLETIFWMSKTNIADIVKRKIWKHI